MDPFMRMGLWISLIFFAIVCINGIAINTCWSHALLALSVEFSCSMWQPRWRDIASHVSRDKNGWQKEPPLSIKMGGSSCRYQTYAVEINRAFWQVEITPKKHSWYKISEIQKKSPNASKYVLVFILWICVNNIF